MHDAVFVERAAFAIDHYAFITSHRALGALRFRLAAVPLVFQLDPADMSRPLRPFAVFCWVEVVPLVFDKLSICLHSAVSIELVLEFFDFAPACHCITLAVVVVPSIMFEPLRLWSGAVNITIPPGFSVFDPACGLLDFGFEGIPAQSIDVIGRASFA